MDFVIKSIKDRYLDLICQKLLIEKKDLTETEIKIIEIGYDLFDEKMDEIDLLKKELRKVTTDLLNMKHYNDDKNYYGDDE